MSSARSRGKSPSRQATDSAAAPAAASTRFISEQTMLERSARITRRELDALWGFFARNPEKMRATQWYQQQAATAQADYHNDLKRLGMTAAQIKSLQRTGHDQFYYVDIVVGVLLLAVAALVMFLWP